MRTIILFLTITLAAVTPASANSLFDDLGGEAGTRAITDDLFDRVVADPRTAPSFAESDMVRVRDNFADQLCELTGGPCVYEWLSMTDAHTGHDVTEAQMNAMIELLRDTLEERGVPFGTQNRLLAILATYHRDIVDAP